MKKYFTFVFLILILAACKKDDPTNNENAKPLPSWPLIKSTTNSFMLNGQFTLPYTDTTYYDSLWRNSSFNYSNPGEVSFDAGTYILSNGLAIQFSGPSIPVTYTYNYDINGYLSDHSSTYYEYNADSNLVRSYYQSQGGNTYITLYTYASGKNTIGNYNYGLYFLGKDSKNVIDHIIYYRVNSPGDTVETAYTNYAHTFDSEGRISGETRVAVDLPNDTSSYTIKQYTYY